MKNIFNIVKKELDKIFKNPRLIFSTFLLSPILLFVIYSTMGNVMNNEMEKMTNKTIEVGIVNVEENNYNASFYEAIKLYNENYILQMTAQDENFVAESNLYTLKYLNINLTFYPEEVELPSLEDANSEIYQEINQTISNDEIDIWLIYEKDFDEIVAELIEAVNNGKTEKVYPQVRYFINSYKTNASMSVERIQQIINIHKQIFFTDIELAENVIEFKLQADLITPKQQENKSLQAIAMLVPMLIIIFIFAGGMSIGADLIAGEKERGTISTLLMTPVNKNQIVLGKIIAGIILTSIAAICSAIGMILSVGELMGVSGGISLSIVQALQLLLTILLLSLLAISIFLVASTLASNIKEASMYVMPVYIIAMVVSLLPMFSEHIPTSNAPYIIPIYNIALAIKGILIGELTGIQFGLIVASTAVYFVLIIFLVTKLFKSEKVMFTK